MAAGWTLAVDGPWHSASELWQRLCSIPAQLFTSIPCYFLLIISCCCSPGGDLPPFGLFPQEPQDKWIYKTAAAQAVFSHPQSSRSLLCCASVPLEQGLWMLLSCSLCTSTCCLLTWHSSNSATAPSNRSIKTQNAVVCLQTPRFPVFFHKKINLILKKKNVAVYW